MPALTVAEIASLCSGVVEGNREQLISGANSLEDAEASDISFVAHDAAAKLAAVSRAGCLLVPRHMSLAGREAMVRVEDPRASFGLVLSVLYARPKMTAYVHPSASIDPTAELGEEVSIGAGTVVGARARIGNFCEIGSNCVIGEDVLIGDQTRLFAQVTIYPGVRVGSRVLFHAGVVLGADGFGFAAVKGHYRKIPQVGTVVIEDDVELGANTCVDRATLGKTVIGQGSKLDNFVHVAHNVRMGKHVVVAAQTGFSGGVVIGDYAVVGGQVGVGDKATIESGAIVGSKSGILTKARARAGEPLWGIPARPLREHLKGLAQVRRLSAYEAELKQVKQRCQELEKRVDASNRQTERGVNPEGDKSNEPLQRSPESD